MQTPTTIRYVIDLKHSIWSHEETEWQEYDAGEIFGVLKNLQPFQTVELCSHPHKEDRQGRVLITRLAHGHYEAHGTFSTSWGTLENIADELEVDMQEPGIYGILDDLMIYNANGEPGVSRDFHFIEGSFKRIMLAVDHVESLLILQDLEEWEQFENACDYIPHNTTWSATHES